MLILNFHHICFKKVLSIKLSLEPAETLIVCGCVFVFVFVCVYGSRG